MVLVVAVVAEDDKLPQASRLGVLCVLWSKHAFR